MLKHFVPLMIIVLISFGCSKKSQENPSPSNNQSPTPTNTNNTKSDAGVYYAFKGNNYKLLSCGYNGSTNGSLYGTYKPLTCVNDNELFKVEDFEIMTYTDSSAFVNKVVGKTLKQFNGRFKTRNKDYPYDVITSYDTLNYKITLSNSSVEYKSFGNEDDTITSPNTHFFKISSFKFKSNGYYNTTLLLTGEFNIRAVNSKDKTDLTDIKGSFKDIPYVFDRNK